MGYRTARLAPRPSPRLRLPTIPLAVILALWLVPAAWGQTGRFLGIFTGAPVTVQTDTGSQSSQADLDLFMEVGPEVNGSRTVQMLQANMVLSGVPTGSGASGVIGLSLSTSGTALLGQDRQLTLPLTFSVHYPLIDQFFPPTPNANAPGDAPEPFLETFTGTLSGKLSFDAPDATWLFETGTLHLDVTGTATGKVLAIDIPVAGFELVAETVGTGLAESEPCPEANRCKERTLKICPVRFISGPGDASPTGSSIARQVETAKQVWRQCCIELDVQATRTITFDALKVLDSSTEDVFTAEELTLYEQVDDRDCVEAYFVARYNPRHANGDGATMGSGTASCKIAVADDGDPHDSVLFAHEVGHCLSLKHSDGGVMTPTGQTPPDPPGQGSFNVPPELCAKIMQPLLRATRRDCCKKSCSSTDSNPPSCRASVSGSGLFVRVQDPESGLRNIDVIHETNTTYNQGDRVNGFLNGSTQEFGFTVDKSLQGQPASITFKVADVCGNAIQCDPIVTLAVRENGRPVTQTFAGVPGEENRLLVVNQTPGLNNLKVTVNGVHFHLGGLKDGEEQALNLSSAMRPGMTNVITLTGHGKPGGSATVMIHD